jgi:hypothetical protein
MRTTNFINVKVNIDRNLIPNRVSVVLSSYRLNEFYTAFKYLKTVLLELFEKETIDITTIKSTYANAANSYGNTLKTIVCSVGEFLKKLPENFFDGYNVFNLKKMNTYHKTFIIAKTVLNDINNY